MAYKSTIFLNNIRINWDVDSDNVFFENKISNNIKKIMNNSNVETKGQKI